MIKNNQILSNSKLNLEEYQSGQTWLNSYPQCLIIELTRSCNLKCPMCRESNKLYAKNNMSMDLFNKIDAYLFDKAKMIDLRGWGESLILDNIVEIIERVAHKGPIIRFVTNLSYAREDVFKVLAKYNCKIDISLDSAEENILHTIRGGANLKRIKENLSVLSSLYMQYQGSTDNLSLLTTVQYPALSTLHKLIPFIASYNIRQVRLFPIAIEDTSELSLENSKDEVEEMLGKIRNEAKAHNVTVIAGAKLGCLPDNPLNMPACIHPWSYAYIAYNGKVGFCDHLIGPAFDDLFMGDLNENSFEDIWNSPKWMDLRQNHLTARDKSIRNFEHCSWCYTNKYIDFEQIFVSSLETSRIII